MVDLSDDEVCDFRTACVSYGILLTDEQLSKFKRYAELLLEWNERFNLTAIIDLKEVYSKHFLDSLVLASQIQKSVSGQAGLLDIGSGAGFPGLALKIAMPSLQVTLCDALRKRVTFLTHVIGELQLQGIVAVHGRAEELAKSASYRDQFAVVTARAVAHLTVLSEWCLPFVRPHGVFIAMKGPTGEQEAIDAHAAFATLNGTLETVQNYNLPDGAGARSLVVVKKIGVTPKRFPRRAGDAERAPLR